MSVYIHYTYKQIHSDLIDINFSYMHKWLLLTTWSDGKLSLKQRTRPEVTLSEVENQGVSLRRQRSLSELGPFRQPSTASRFQVSVCVWVNNVLMFRGQALECGW